MVKKIQQLWHNEQGLQSATGLLVVTMFLSNVLGFLRDMVLANTLPLTVLDTYYAAFRIPDLLFNLFILGAITSAFIPVYLDVKAKDGDDAAWRLAHNLLHTALVVLILLGIVLFALMPTILPAFVPGFDAAKTDQTVLLARILLLSPFFFALSYVLGGVLNAHQKFFAYSLAPLVYNISIIAGGLLALNYNVVIVAWFVVLGALLHVVVQVPVLSGLGYRYKFVLDWTDPQLGKVVRLMIPRAISLGMTQFILIAFTRLGSFLATGAVSIYTLTNNLQTAPVAIFGASIATAVFPMLGKASSEDDEPRFRTLLSESLCGMFFFMIPITALAWVLRAHIIRLYLALNHQTWDDTIRAIATFQWFILALVAQAFILIMIRAFYARHDTRTPMIIAIFSGLVSIVLATIFVQNYADVSSLSLAFLVGVSVEAVLLLALFIVKNPKLIDFTSVLQSVFVASVLALLSGLFARLILSIVSEGAIVPSEGLGTSHIVPLFGALVAAAVGGIGLYIALSYLFKRHEMRWLFPKRATDAVLLADSEDVAQHEDLS